jgi:hypothetical protein
MTALAFVRAGFTTATVFGGSESCLTPYTIAHLEALRIYADGGKAWPCRPCGSVSFATNTVALGEAAGTAILMEDDNAEVEGDLELLGIGWAVEETPTATGLSADGHAFERSMKMALEHLGSERKVDTVVVHAPGSVRGDEAELRAVARTFGEGVMVCSSKHLTGHTYDISKCPGLQGAELVGMVVMFSLRSKVYDAHVTAWDRGCVSIESGQGTRDEIDNGIILPLHAMPVHLCQALVAWAMNQVERVQLKYLEVWGMQTSEQPSNLTPAEFEIIRARALACGTRWMAASALLVEAFKDPRGRPADRPREVGTKTL